MTAAAAPSLLVSSAPGRWVLAVTVLGSGIASLDATVVNIALPSIGRQFHAGTSTLQWIMTGYTLTLAAFLLVGGTLGDRFGRRRVYLTGVVWFALASAACGFAPDGLALIVTRVLQGVGAALLVPGSLAILEASFAPADRSRAIGAWSGLSGVATAAGPLLGGFLITAATPGATTAPNTQAARSSGRRCADMTMRTVTRTLGGRSAHGPGSADSTGRSWFIRPVAVASCPSCADVR